MKAREKWLLIAVGGIVGAFLLGYTLKTILSRPLKAAELRNAGLRSRLNKLKEERRAYFDAEDRVKRFTERTFADSVDDASARSGEFLTQAILHSGLREADFTRLPVGPRRIVPKGDLEIGWNIQGSGALSNVINLLYLLQESPQLHRIENLSLGSGDRPGTVSARFKYLTLVISPAPAVELKPLPVASLENSKRHLYTPILTRDILRPYLRRPPPPPAPPTPPAPAPAAVVSAPPGPGPETFRVVSLSEWSGKPEVHVLSLTAQKTTAYRVGDTLATGTVVMVDYRPLPMPGKPGLQSFSRVILKIDDEYWAVERGQTLADKYKLTPDQVPQTLVQVQPPSSAAK